MEKEAAQRQEEQRRAVEQEKQDRERGAKALNDFLIDTRTQMASAVNAAEAQRQRMQAMQLDRIRIAFKEFESARTELSAALGFKAKLKDPGRKLAKSTAVFLDFIKRSSKETPRLDPSEFKDFTPSDLGWETLTSAERITPHLAAVMLMENELTVDVGFVNSLSKLQAELLRLQWMAQRLK